MNNLGLEPKHMKESRLEHFFKDILGTDRTIPRAECDWHDPMLDKEPTDEEMDAIVGKYIDDPDDILPLVDQVAVMNVTIVRDCSDKEDFEKLHRALKGLKANEINFRAISRRSGESYRESNTSSTR